MTNLKFQPALLLRNNKLPVPQFGDVLYLLAVGGEEGERLCT
jgi:hypothetical protein